MDPRLQAAVIVACLLAARAIPWIADKTGVTISAVQLTLAGLYIAVFAVMLSARPAHSPAIYLFKNAQPAISILAGVGLFVIAGVAYAIVANIYARAGWSQPQELAYFSVKSAGAAFSLFTFLIGAVLLEEYLFRGLVQTVMQERYGVLFAVLLSSALFALYHLSAFQAAATFILGIGLGLLFVRTNSLASPIIAHFIFNLIGAALFISGAGARS